MSYYRDLSGAELRARLTQRGVSPDRVALLVALRDRPDVERILVRLLGPRSRRPNRR